jgi:hypothetical protein
MHSASYVLQHALRTEVLANTEYAIEDVFDLYLILAVMNNPLILSL